MNHRQAIQIIPNQCAARPRRWDLLGFSLAFSVFAGGIWESSSLMNEHAESVRLKFTVIGIWMTVIIPVFAAFAMAEFLKTLNIGSVPGIPESGIVGDFGVQYGPNYVDVCEYFERREKLAP